MVGGSFEVNALPPPLSGDGAFGCFNRNLVYGDYFPKLDKVLEICKVRNGYTFNFGKYESSNVESIFYPEENVTITPYTITLKRKDVTYTLEVSRNSYRTLKRSGDYFEIIELGDDVFYMINGLSHFVPTLPPTM